MTVVNSDIASISEAGQAAAVALDKSLKEECDGDNNVHQLWLGWRGPGG